MSNNPYSRNTTIPNTALYSLVNGNRSREPGMREELIRTLDGGFPEIAKGYTIVLRIMNKDENDNLIPCSCVDYVSGEADKDRFCPFCFGEGFLWTETYAKAYKVQEASDNTNALLNVLTPVGQSNIPLISFYLKYDSNITISDKIIEIALSSDGSVITPVTRTNVYKIEAPWSYRADNGRLEYWKIYGHKQSVKHLNAPVYGE